MKRDYTDQVAEYWPTIMRAWHAYADKRPVIECDIVKRQVLAWPAQEYINGLSARTREVTRRQFRRATAAGGIMIFIRDSKNRILQSQVHMPDETSEPKPIKSRGTNRRPTRPLDAGEPT